jgi:hypothetical protein
MAVRVGVGAAVSDGVVLGELNGVVELDPPEQATTRTRGAATKRARR